MTISTHSTSPNPISVRLGFWSAFLIAVVFVVFTICFIVIALTRRFLCGQIWRIMSPTPASGVQVFQHLARLMMLAFGPLFVVLLNSLLDYVLPKRKSWSRLP